MSKIIIREYDNTKPGLAEYANFSVAIPGFCKNKLYDKWDIVPGTEKSFLVISQEDGCYYYHAEKAAPEDGIKVFDENGIYECNSAANFETYIGWTSKSEEMSVHLEAIAANLTPFTDGNYLEALNELDFNKYRNQRILYYANEITEAEKKEGYLKKKIDNKYYSFSQVPSDAQYSAGATLALIQAGDEGRDASDTTKSIGHFGNQIAYEALCSGYIVLFKFLGNKITAVAKNNTEVPVATLADLETSVFWQPLKDKSSYDFRYILTGLLENNSGANNKIAELASYSNKAEVIGGPSTDTGRGDIIALLDVDKNAYMGKKQAKAIIGIKNEIKKYTSDKYSTIFAPCVTYGLDRGAAYKIAYNSNVTFPGSFHYLACAAKALQVYPEWFAVSGYTRGISDYSIASTGCKLGEVAVDSLQKRNTIEETDVNKAVNLIINIRGQYLLWGNRTTEALGAYGGDSGDLKASHFLNIRQLCCTLKKQIYIACRQLTFEPNSDILWINFKNKVRPILEKMKANQGIKDYLFEKKVTNQKALLTAYIRIIPIEAVEDFDISVLLEDSLEGVVVTEE